MQHGSALLVLALAGQAWSQEGAVAAGVAMADSTNAFAIDLHRRLCQRQGNLFVSPYSIAVALAMVTEGARGTTRTQLERVLHVEDTALAATCAELARALEPPRLPDDSDPTLTKKVPAFELRVANRVWALAGLDLLPRFVEVLDKGFGAPLDRVDFSDVAGARQTINAWVEEKTRRRIRDLIPDGMPKPDTRLVLANAIYFLAAWATPFDQGATADAAFTTGAGQSVRVPTMRAELRCPYAEVEGAQILELPYRAEAMSMVVVLPRAKDGLRQLETGLGWPQVRGWLAKLESRKVAVSLPRFTVTASLDLGAVLAELGASDAFDPDKADFTGMTSAERLKIDAVLHKAFVAVDESGTEAAAATAVLMGPTGIDMEEPIAFEADHPFLFFIRHRATGCLLFAGRLDDPSR